MEEKINSIRIELTPTQRESLKEQTGIDADAFVVASVERLREIADAFSPAHVKLEPTEFPYTSDQLLWEVIKDRTEALASRHYSDFTDRVMSDAAPSPQPRVAPPKGGS